MGKNGIVRLDLVNGHKYHYNIGKELENGLLVEIDHKEETVAVTTDITKQQHLVCSVANLYDSMDESDFINMPDGMKARVLTFEVGDIFTTTQVEDGAVNKGDFGYATVGGKFTVDAEASVDAVQVFRVVEETRLNGQRAVAFKVEKAV